MGQLFSLAYENVVVYEFLCRILTKEYKGQIDRKDQHRIQAVMHNLDSLKYDS